MAPDHPATVTENLGQQFPMFSERQFNFHYNNQQYQTPWSIFQAQAGAGRDIRESTHIVNNVDNILATPRDNSYSESIEPYKAPFESSLLMLNNPVHNQAHDSITSAEDNKYVYQNQPPSMTSGDTCVDSLLETRSYLDSDPDLSPVIDDLNFYSSQFQYTTYAGGDYLSINPTKLTMPTFKPEEQHCFDIAGEDAYSSNCRALEDLDYDMGESVSDYKERELNSKSNEELLLQTLDPKAKRKIAAHKAEKLSANKVEKRTSRTTPKASKKGIERKASKPKKTRERLKCSHCNNTFSNSSELKKHVQVKHERPFQCTFFFAGCVQYFGSKNEWKRHVTSQHMSLFCWKCNLSTCMDRHATFNRRDLFGQHLKRMHQPEGNTPLESCISDNEKAVFQRASLQEQRDRWTRHELPKIQDQCFIIWRNPPSASNCEVCGKVFEGLKCWDAKMEHVGKHHENGDKPEPGAPHLDHGLIKWALEHRLIEERTPYDGGSESSNDEIDDIGSLSTSKPMENNHQYKFTKHDPFGSVGKATPANQINGGAYSRADKESLDYDRNNIYSSKLYSNMLEPPYDEEGHDEKEPHDSHKLLPPGSRIVS